MLASFFRRFARDRRGATAVYIAVLSTVLVGIGALAIDIPRMASFTTDLQSAADAAALAGARELDSGDGSQARATAAAIDAFTNAQKFGTGSADVTLTAANIKFLSSLPTNDSDPVTAFTTDDSDSHFIQVTTPDRDIGFMFASVLGGAQSTTTHASAIAGNSPLICRTVPMFMCNPSEPAGNTDTTLKPDYTALKGRMIQSYIQNASSFSPGNFGLLCPAGTSDVQNCGGSGLPANFASTTGTCLQVGGLTTKTGATLGPVSTGVNVRFDEWDSSTKDTGGGNWRENAAYAPSLNVTQGANKATNANGNQTACQRTDTPPTSTPPAADALTVDTCFTTGTCSYNGNTNIGDGQWDNTTYFNVNHGNVGGWPPSNWPGTAPTTPSRYEAYRYELETNSVVQKNQAIVGSTTTTTYENGGPQCYIGPTPPADGITFLPNETIDKSLLADRRLLVIAMADCHALALGGGKQTFTAADYAYEFLTMPMGNDPTTNQQTIDAEIVGPIDETTRKQIFHNVVQLYRR